MPWVSNATFLVEVKLKFLTRLAVYKPERGERPLWRLSARPLQARARRPHLFFFFVELVPLTIEREGPYGEGLVPAVHLRPTSSSTTSPCARSPSTASQLQCMRPLRSRGQQCRHQPRRRGSDGIYGVDNGLCFHVEPKGRRRFIRTFGAEPIPPPTGECSSRSPAREASETVAALLDLDRAEGAPRARASALAQRAECFSC